MTHFHVIEIYSSTDKIMASDVVPLNLGTRKRRTKKVAASEVDSDPPKPSSDLIDNNNVEPDYDYFDLLHRCFSNNEESEKENKQKLIIKPPHIARIGTKKIAFTNHLEICKAINRESTHVAQFLLAELVTSGSIDGSQNLIIKGRFQSNNIERVFTEVYS